ncbi:MAG: hypothetical protein K0R75_985 [Paenibacillaceae bacterium]|jgi:hypothetical protein|nr:hypothetical protein [Paenibacillaceae bacterium]
MDDMAINVEAINTTLQVSSNQHSEAVPVFLKNQSKYLRETKYKIKIAI